MAVRVAAQAALRAAAKQAVKQVVKQTVKQAVKQTVKKTVKQTVKKATKQATKKTTKKTTKKQTTKKTTKTQTKKSTTKKPTVRAKVKKPTKPIIRKPQAKKPQVNRPQAKKPQTKKSQAKKPTKTTKKPPTKKTAKKPPTKPKPTTRKKNDIAQEQNEMILNDVDIAEMGGVDPDFGYDGDLLCRSLISCAKDVVEELGENAAEDIADEVIGQVIDATIPEVPVDAPGSGVTCALPNSFVAGTLVLMADGSRKPIEQIKAGEEVLATDPSTGRTAARPVTTLITSEGAKNLVDITITVDGKSDVLTATDEHPFWLPKRQTWLNAGDLRPGMWLQTSAGTYVQVSAVEHRTATRRVHNLTVEDFHTYHVVAGGQAILVHNDAPRYTDEECWAIADRARDKVREGMSKTQRSKHVMIVGAVDCVTGDVVVGKKRSERGGSTHCAEDLARDELVSRGSKPENIRFGHPAHPNTMNEADFCPRCQGWIDPSQVPPDRRW